MSITLRPLFFWAAICLMAPGALGEVIVVHPDTTMDSLPRNVARGIFSMRLREWEDGTPITVFVLADKNPSHRSFVQKVLKMFPHQLRRNWDRYRYTGTGQAPIQVRDEQEMIERILATPGSIGYIHEDATDAQLHTVHVQ